MVSSNKDLELERSYIYYLVCIGNTIDFEKRPVLCVLKTKSILKSSALSE